MIPRFFKWGTLLGIAMLIAISAYGAYLYRQIRDCAARDDAQPSDAIVVLGAAQYNGRPSPVLKARLDHAIALFRAGLAPVVIVTGGIGTGDHVSEAAVGHRYLRALAVPNSAIVVRPDGRTTDASMRSV